MEFLFELYGSVFGGLVWGGEGEEEEKCKGVMLDSLESAKE